MMSDNDYSDIRILVDPMREMSFKDVEKLYKRYCDLFYQKGPFRELLRVMPFHKRKILSAYENIVRLFQQEKLRGRIDVSRFTFSDPIYGEWESDARNNALAQLKINAESVNWRMKNPESFKNIASKMQELENKSEIEQEVERLSRQVYEPNQLQIQIEKRLKAEHSDPNFIQGLELIPYSKRNFIEQFEIVIPQHMNPELTGTIEKLYSNYFKIYMENQGVREYITGEVGTKLRVQLNSYIMLVHKPTDVQKKGWKQLFHKERPPEFQDPLYLNWYANQTKNIEDKSIVSDVKKMESDINKKVEEERLKLKNDMEEEHISNYYKTKFVSVFYNRILKSMLALGLLEGIGLDFEKHVGKFKNIRHINQDFDKDIWN
jgi:hypothetical protein